MTTKRRLQVELSDVDYNYQCTSSTIRVVMHLKKHILLISILALLWSPLQQVQVSALSVISPQARVKNPIATGTRTRKKGTEEKIPFLIQQLGTESQPSKRDAVQISDIVISVFFEEEAELSPEKKSKGFITKPFILAYLKNLQYGDVRGKKFMLGKVNNSMFVARQIVPAAAAASATVTLAQAQAQGLSLQELAKVSTIGKNQGQVYNSNLLQESPEGYALGDILGFVDVTEKNFGLPNEVTNGNGNGNDNESNRSSTASTSTSDTDTDGSDDSDKGEEAFIRRKSRTSLRPILTNLSVTPKARCSGVGSALVNACESVVMEPLEWSRNYSDLVLEVEEENIGAQKFYERREYKALFSDPTSRRYDASGFILNNVRTTKICYRKDLTKKRAGRNSGSGGNGTGGSGGALGLFFAKIKQAMGI